MIYSIILCAIYQLTASKRLLQQFTPVGPTLGTYGQTCLPPNSDFECQRTHTTITDQQQGTLECGVDYACCLCESVICGSAAKWCDTFKVGGQFGAFGVQDIRIYGHPDTTGSVVDCGAPNACAGSSITGKWIDTIKCAGDGACNGASVDIAMSQGMTCDKEACVGGKFVMNSNLGGDINCGAQKACVGAEIEINGIEHVKCNGRQACQGATITINSPLEHFHLDCNGILACENLEVIITIPEPTGGCTGTNFNIIEWKGISCGTNGGCEGLKFTVVNNGCQMIRIEDLQCNPVRACTGAVFDFNAGTGPYGVDLQNCMCGPSCLDAAGIDKCYNNVRTLECVDANSCAWQSRTITNPANNFLMLCPSERSCAGLKLDLVIAGASQNLVQRLDGFDCGGIKSCKNAKINIVNTQTRTSGALVSISVADIICSQAEACDGATFITGSNVQIERVICTDGACDNCFIKETETSTGVPCADGAVTPIVSAPNNNAAIPPPPPQLPSAPSVPIEQPPQLPNNPEPIVPNNPQPIVPNAERGQRFVPIDPASQGPAIPAIPSIPAIPAIPAVPSDPIPVIPEIPINPPVINPPPQRNQGGAIEVPPFV